ASSFRSAPSDASHASASSRSSARTSRRKRSTSGVTSRGSTRIRQGKRKRLERLPRLAPPPGDPAAMDLKFEVAERGGDQVIAVKDLTVEVPGRVLVEDFTAVLRRNDFVALIGPNGAGKTSFILTIIGDRE